MTDERDQDALVERILQRSALPEPGDDARCLDAELFAAWADGSLGATARLDVEEHLATCARCQALAATFARIEPAAPAEAPERARGWLGWLVPTAAVAASALTVWVLWPSDNATLSPAPEPARQMAEARQEQGPQIPVEPPAPAPPVMRTEPLAKAQPPEARARRDEASAGDTAPARPAAEPAPAAAAPETGVRQQMADAQQRTETFQPPPAAPAEPGRSAELTRSAPDADSARDAVTAAPAAPAARAAPATAPATPPPAAAGRAGRGGRGGGGGRGAPIAALAAPARELRIASPNALVLWRVIDGQEVQRTDDGGGTWRSLFAVPDMALRAGAAPAGGSCWLAGQAGAVFVINEAGTWARRTITGNPDVSAIVAVDGTRATVTATDGRVFSTTDAGLTWREGPLQGF